MERLIGLDPQLLHDTIFTAIAVFFLFTFLSYLLFNPVRKLLEERSKKIATEISEAKEGKEAAVALKAEYEGKLENADKEVEGILSEARGKALKSETRIVAEAKEEAHRIITRANTEAELEKKRVLDEVKQEMVAIAAMMATKAVSDAITPTIQDGLVDEALKEMGERTWLS